ncbi:MAG: DUF2065 family protein [Parachlamydiaceae bacterium]|nr:DUF2065 family protein [Parachlamydiaceae bacterium]
MSLILAKIFGLYFLAIGIAFMVAPERLRKISQLAKNDENFLFLGGLLALLIGAVVVSIHNIWVLGWPVIITILGWWSLIKGFALLSYPGFINLFSFVQNRSDLFYRSISLIYLVLGLFLVYKGTLSPYNP